MRTLKLTLKQKRTISLLALAATTALAGCGRSGSTPVGGAGAPGAPGVPGFGAGCMPLQQMAFPFTTANVNFTPNARTITIGALPNYGVTGQVQMGGVATPGPFQGVLKGAGYGAQFGNVSLNLYSQNVYQQYPNGYNTGYNQYPVQTIPGLPPGAMPIYPNQLSSLYPPAIIGASGVLQINQNTVMDIQNQVMMGLIPLGLNVAQPQFNPLISPIGYNGGFNTNPMYYQQPQFNPAGLQQICVSQVALRTSVTLSGQLYIGDIYLYLNNTQHGIRYILQTQ